MSLALAMLPVLVPVFLIILLGQLLRQQDFPGQGFWQPAERLTYYLLFPALLIEKTASAPPLDREALSLAWALAACLATACLLLLGLRRWLADTPAAFTSVFQGAVRFNTYVGLAIVLPLFGAAGVLTSAVVIALLIPLVNLASVIVLIRYGRGEGRGVGQIGRAMIANPVVIACLTGLALNGLELDLPMALDRFLVLLGRASLPLGLLCVGAGLRFDLPSKARRSLMAAALARLTLMPLLLWGYALLFGVPEQMLVVAVLFAGLPGSPLSAILARQLGGDAELMAGIVTLETGLAFFSLPLLGLLLP